MVEKWALYYIDEAGERRKLGETIFPLGASAKKIKSRLMDLYWDDRLDAASCVPDIEMIDE